MTADIQPSKGKSIATWVLTVLLALAMLGAGSGKLMGAEQLVQNFETWGYPSWFLTLTGAIEVGAAILLLIPRTSGLGALLIVPTMIGAVLTHIVFPPIAEVVPSLVLLVISSTVLFLRRDKLRALVPGRAAATAPVT